MALVVFPFRHDDVAVFGTVGLDRSHTPRRDRRPVHRGSSPATATCSKRRPGPPRAGLTTVEVIHQDRIGARDQGRAMPCSRAFDDSWSDPARAGFTSTTPTSAPSVPGGSTSPSPRSMAVPTSRSTSSIELPDGRPGHVARDEGRGGPALARLGFPRCPPAARRRVRSHPGGQPKHCGRVPWCGSGRTGASTPSSPSR